MTQLAMQRGTTAKFNIVIARDGVPIDVSGASLTFVASPKISVSGVTPITKTDGAGIVIDPDQVANTGKITLTIDAGDTASFPASELNLDYSLTMELGGETSVPDDGVLVVVPRLYATLTDVREAGLDESVASDSAVLAAIVVWQRFIERATRQWFYPRAMQFRLDGTDSDTLHLAVPIIAVSELRINGDTTALDPTYYRVYNGFDYPDDRRNPRIKLIDTLDHNLDIYTAPLRDGRLWFRKGRLNQYVDGMFGYVEEDGSTPALIRRAVLKLVIEKLATPLYSGVSGAAPPPPIITGVVTEEWTDGHRLKYATSGGELNPRPPGLSGVTNDPEVLGIIKLYKAPIGLSTPAHPSYR